MNENTNTNHTFSSNWTLICLIFPSTKNMVSQNPQQIIEITHLLKHFTELRLPIAIHFDSKPPIEVFNLNMR